METLKYFYLYKITNKINGKIYIGVHETKNLDDGYMGSGLLIQKAIKKYGIENFDKDILDFFDNRLLMLDKEGEIVTEDFVKRKDNYNIDLGGRGDSKNLRLGTPAFVEKIKNDSLFKQRNQENLLNGYRNKVENEGFWWQGREHKEETKKKIGESNAINQKGERNSQFGTKWIYNLELEENRKIDKDENIPECWIEGRIIDFKKKKENLKSLEKKKEKKSQRIQRCENAIKVKIKKHKKKRLRKEDLIKKYTEWFLIYDEFGFSEFVRITGYDKSKANLVKQFAKYVEEFIPQNGKQRGK